MTEADSIIQKLNLMTHPEGGYFRESYRSEGSISNNSLPGFYSGERNYSTAIYFLLKSEEFSAFHKIHQDEGWHFYSGSPIQIHMIDSSGKYTSVIMHNSLDNDYEAQFFVPGGCWFAAEVKKENSYALVGCTVSPGFDFADFEMAEAEKLTNLSPENEELIKRLCI